VDCVLACRVLFEDSADPVLLQPKLRPFASLTLYLAFID
jgi:hypothetical protein